MKKTKFFRVFRFDSLKEAHIKVESSARRSGLIALIEVSRRVCGWILTAGGWKEAWEGCVEAQWSPKFEGFEAS